MVLVLVRCCYGYDGPAISAVPNNVQRVHTARASDRFPIEQELPISLSVGLAVLVWTFKRGFHNH
jgi:hypothetical protein